MFCHRHPKRIAVKSCFYCGRHICPKCQWRSSYHTFCSHACYRRHIFWQSAKEIQRLAIGEVRAIWLSFYKKIVDIPIDNVFIPIVLPIITLSSLYTYTTLTVKNDNTPLLHETQGSGSSNLKIQNLPSGTQEQKFQEPAVDAAFTTVASNAPSPEDTLRNLIERKIKLRPKLSDVAKPRFITPDITRGSLMKKELSLTFDGGSEATDADEILKILRERDIKTTIFLTGGFIERYPELVKKMAEDGHEIGNHSLTHPHLTTFESNFKQQTLPGIDREFIIRQLKETAKIFRELTGKDMIPYWRAPYGEQNAEIRQWAYKAGFTHVGWTTGYRNRESLDTLDWVSNEESEFYYSADEIKERVLNFDKEGNGVSGGIVLMHLGTERKESHAYTKLPEIIDTLTDRGYKIVKVTELLSSRK